MKSLIMLIVFVALSEACGFLGGGGGGCCGGCGGGCGRRKKRSIEENEHLKSSDSDMLCNSPELKRIIIDSMQETPSESGRVLQNALEDFEPNRYVIVCSEHPFQYTVRHDTAYCGARNGSHYCQAFISPPASTDLAIVRARRQCGGSNGCCAGDCNCGQMGVCGQMCCVPSQPNPCACGTPGCMQCVTQTVLVPVQTTTCCKCCQPVCTNACVTGGGCSCGCTRGGCNRKRRSLLAIANEEMNKNGEHMIGKIYD